MRIGSKKIFHLEAWVVKVMSLYKVRLFLELQGGWLMGFNRSNPSISLIFPSSSNLQCVPRLTSILTVYNMCILFYKLLDCKDRHQ
jgi:hypothetical protein